MISIICPIYNEERYINKCIESILSQDYPHEDLDVLFVDGMSNDKTREIIVDYIEKYPFIRLIDNPERIVPYAMNRGIKAAIGDIIIRLDAHAVYPSNYFSCLVFYLRKLNADNVGAVCRTLPAKNTLKCKAIAEALSSSFGMGNSYFRIGVNEIREVDTVPFGCYKRDVFKRIGYYDYELVRNQDDELNARLKKKGGKIFLLPNLVVDYFARDGILKTSKMFFQYGLYKPLVNKKIGSPTTIRQFFPVFFVLGLVIGLPLSLFFDPIMYCYVSILTLYLFLALMSSLKSSLNILQVFYQILTCFIIHISYGFGYLKGIYNIIFKRQFNVKINR